jgi:uncharacterized membrane protein
MRNGPPRNAQQPALNNRKTGNSYMPLAALPIAFDALLIAFDAPFMALPAEFMAFSAAMLALSAALFMALAALDVSDLLQADRPNEAAMISDRAKDFFMGKPL